MTPFDFTFCFNHCTFIDEANLNTIMKSFASLKSSSSSSFKSEILYIIGLFQASAAINLVCSQSGVTEISPGYNNNFPSYISTTQESSYSTSKSPQKSFPPQIQEPISQKFPSIDTVCPPSNVKGPGRYCIFCGVFIEGIGARFCPECGKQQE